MKTYLICDKATENSFVLPLQRTDDINSLPRFSYYTLCRLSDAVSMTHPTPNTLAEFCKRAGHSYKLKLDNLGNFVSFHPVA